MSASIRILGLISDTHGLLRNEAVCALQGSDLILHAGDVGASEILEELRCIAPLVAVRGNVDTEAWADALPLMKIVEAGSATICMIHILQDLDLNPKAAGFSIVVSGHSHKSAQIEKDGVLYINPGSAGPRRFHLPVTVAKLDLQVLPWRVDFLELRV